jgi:hypothetical protein
MQKILCFVIAGLAGLVLAEGTVVETKTMFSSPAKYELAWTASTNGIVSQTTTFYVRGELARVVFGGGTTPNTIYVTLKDTAGVDVLAGQGIALVSNVVVSVVPGLMSTDGVQSNTVPFVVNDLLTLSVTNAGSLKTGNVILYVK